MFKLSNIKATGTLWHFEFFEKNIPLDLENSIRAELTRFENKFSRFKETSLLTKLNLEREITFDSEMFDLIKLCTYYNEKTKFIFNPLIGHILENNGYTTLPYSKRSKSATLEYKSISGYFKISDKKISLETSCNLDLGGIGKGYLIKNLYNIIKEKFGLKYFFINAGGDIYATSENEGELKFYLESPFDNSKYLWEVFLKNKSLCVSSPQKRKWKNEKGTFSHFINPADVSSLDFADIAYCTGDDVVNTDVGATVLCISKKADFDEIAKNLNIEYLVLKDGDIFKSKGFQMF